MSAFEDEMTVNMNKVPTYTLERAYWRRKLPPAFRFYLEMLARELMLSQPNNVNAHAAGFFEELLIQRDTELSLLPHEPYFDKLLKNALAGGRPAKARLEEPLRPPGASGPCTSVRCNRCGRFLKGGPGDGGVSPGTGPSGSVCSSSPGAGVVRPQATYRHLEGDGECRVMALSHQRDAFGRLPTRRGVKDEELITCRSLAILVDY